MLVPILFIVEALFLYMNAMTTKVLCEKVALSKWRAVVLLCILCFIAFLLLLHSYFKIAIVNAKVAVTFLPSRLFLACVLQTNCNFFFFGFVYLG